MSLFYASEADLWFALIWSCWFINHCLFLRYTSVGFYTTLTLWQPWNIWVTYGLVAWIKTVASIYKFDAWKFWTDGKHKPISFLKKWIYSISYFEWNCSSINGCTIYVYIEIGIFWYLCQITVEPIYHSLDIDVEYGKELVKFVIFSENEDYRSYSDFKIRRCYRISFQMWTLNLPH